MYIQIYDGSQRDGVREYRDAWQKIGASVPPIENVTDSARKAGRPAPSPVRGPTVRFHDQASIDCAVALGPAFGFKDWRVEPLSPQLKATSRTIEVWIPPPEKAAQ
ncbi:UNVERIFIED_ORG: hypothetical protein J2W38_005628 [Variovorax paradoxus]|nr:hypothetical protein [Variovorax paradoxus]